MNKIKRVSLFFRVLFQIILLFLPLFYAITWMRAPKISWLIPLWGTDVIPAIYHTVIPEVLSLHQKILGFSVGVIPVIAKCFILYFLIKLFRLYERNEIFSLNNVRYIRNISYALLIEQLLQSISDFILGFVLTWNNLPGQRIAEFRIGGTELSIILAALILILVSWIMAEGCKLREEQQLTI